MPDLLDFLDPQTVGVLLSGGGQPGLTYDRLAPKAGQYPEPSAPPVDPAMMPAVRQHAQAGDAIGGVTGYPPAANAGFSTFGEEAPPPMEGYRGVAAPPPTSFAPAAGAGAMPNDPGTPMPAPADNAGLSRFGGDSPFPPLPQPRPDVEPPAGATPTSGPPLDISPPQASPSGMLPPAVSRDRGGIQRRSDGLLSALGIDLGISPETKAGLGKGLAAVAQNWNKPGLAAAAGTAGAALQGEGEEGHKQRTFKNQEEDAKFKRTSTAFNDMNKAAMQRSTEEYRQAQAKYLTARAKATASGQGGKGKEDWRNTPFGALVTADQRAQMWYDGQMKALRDQWKLNFTPKEEQDKQKADLDTKRDAFRDRFLATVHGISPEQATKLRNTGTKPPVNGKFPDDAPPFDPRTMGSIEEFKNTVPIGAWYLDETGTPRIRRRKEVEPGKQSSATDIDDQIAMAG